MSEKFSERPNIHFKPSMDQAIRAFAEAHDVPYSTGCRLLINMALKQAGFHPRPANGQQHQPAE